MTNESSIVATATAAAGLSIMAAATLDATQVMVAAFGFATTVSTLYFAYITAKMNRSLIATKEEVVTAKQEVIKAAVTAEETAKVAVVTAQTAVAKTDKLVEQTEVIHKLTNANLQESEKKRVAAEERSFLLQAMVDKLLSQAVEANPSRTVEPKNG